MNAYENYSACVLMSVVIRIIYHKLAWKICAHSDGGGYDSGTEYSYVPTLFPEYSVMMDREFGYAAQNARVKGLTWLLLPLLPLYWIIQGLQLVHYMFLRAEYFFSYGKISTLVPRKAHSHERERAEP
jgi:hypothetical protein